MNEVSWNNYIEYLLDWANQHRDAENMGMSPAGWEEFLDWENED